MGFGIYVRLIVILFVSRSVVDLAAANIMVISIQCGSPAVASLGRKRGALRRCVLIAFFVYFFFFRVFSAPVLLVDHFCTNFALCVVAILRPRVSTRPLAT